jgi:hypothetical protein
MFGILVFALLYVAATFYYPGGSNADKTTAGFDWFNNYWCDLTGQFAKNGATNSARPIALTAMIILCSTLAVFWFYVPRLFSDNKFNQVIRYAGITSMTVAVFLFTDFHDTVINVAGTLGIAALTGVFIGLYKNNLTKLFGYGVFLFRNNAGQLFYLRNKFSSFVASDNSKSNFYFVISVDLSDRYLSLPNNKSRNYKRTITVNLNDTTMTVNRFRQAAWQNFNTNILILTLF